jgi:hypothetical protein
MRELRYRIMNSAVGALIVGASDDGCCLVEYLDRGGLDSIRARFLLDLAARNAAQP